MKIMAFVAHLLHFSYSDMIEMDISDFKVFIDEAKEIEKSLASLQ